MTPLNVLRRSLTPWTINEPSWFRRYSLLRVTTTACRVFTEFARFFTYLKLQSVKSSALLPLCVTRKQIP